MLRVRGIVNCISRHEEQKTRVQEMLENPTGMFLYRMIMQKRALEMQFSESELLENFCFVSPMPHVCYPYQSDQDHGCEYCKRDCPVLHVFRF
jgi:hypothetical protein